MTEFTEKEVKEAIFQIEHNKALGPDVFPVEFYQVFWELIKADSCLSSLNFTKATYLYSALTLV
jgi:hypothetical protein